MKPTAVGKEHKVTDAMIARYVAQGWTANRIAREFHDATHRIKRRIYYMQCDGIIKPPPSGQPSYGEILRAQRLAAEKLREHKWKYLKLVVDNGAQGNV